MLNTCSWLSIIVLAIVLILGYLYFMYRQNQDPSDDNGNGNGNGYGDEYMNGNGNGYGDGNGDGGNGQGQGRLMLFFATWCPHCASLLEKSRGAWDRLTNKYNGHPGVAVEKIDGDQNPQLMDQYNIKGFPSILFEQGNKLFSYSGDRSFQSIEAWLQKFI